MKLKTKVSLWCLMGLGVLYVIPLPLNNKGYFPSLHLTPDVVPAVVA